MKKTFYLYKSGTLQRKDDSLALIDKSENVTYIPIIQTNIIIVFSDITFNKRVLQLLNRYDIVVIFFNYYGQYIGRFTPKRYVDGKILIKQVETYNSNRRIVVAQKMVRAELKNVVSVLKYYHKKHHSFVNDIEDIIGIIEAIDSTGDIEELLLLEAQAKKKILFNI